MDFEIVFEEDLTVIVGENDSGKTSLLECLRVITQNKPVEIDDFSHGKNTIELEIEVEDFIFERAYKLSGECVEEDSFVARPTDGYIKRIKDAFSKDAFDISIQENEDLVRNTAKTFGIVVRSNSKIENLKAGVLNKIGADSKTEEIVVENAKFPQFNNIQLDGRQFENVSSFFKEVFLKEKQSSIWREKINEETTIEDFVKSRISDYSEEISEKMSQEGILEKIKIFLKDLTDIKIEPQYQSKDLNIDAKVKFLENGNEINLEKKGDGTKRRITMALLEFKKEESLLAHDDTTFYLLDEPDTHLHVKAQIELLETMRSFASDGNQVVLTTHSPFIINAVNPKQIRLIENYKNSSKIKSLKKNKDSSNRILQSLGVENTFLFFSKHLIIVEGETEASFLRAYYMQMHNKPITSGLIKIVNTEGISNVPGFAAAILEIHNPENIYLVIDNDALPNTQELIDKLSIPDTRKFVIGEKEFEDAFHSETLHRCWCTYLRECDKNIPASWTQSDIESAKQECLQNNGKFSKKMRSLGAGSKQMTKPIFAKALGDYVEVSELPDQIKMLLNVIQ